MKWNRMSIGYTRAPCVKRTDYFSTFKLFRVNYLVRFFVPKNFQSDGFVGVSKMILIPTTLVLPPHFGTQKVNEWIHARGHSREQD